jgi:ATP-dependent exoDNAse (exonuclease V) beta subunit
MTRYVITESSLHYAMGFLQRYAENYPTKKHQDALKDFRDLSDKLLGCLEEPMTLNIVRHNLRKDE